MKPDTREHEERSDGAPNRDGDSDAQLTRSAAGDAAAFTPLVEAYSPALHGYFARRMPGAADDLLAEAWLQAFAARRTFDPSRGSARGWLFGVARNVLAQHLRRAGRQETVPAVEITDPWQAVDQRLDAAALAPRCAGRWPNCPSRSGRCCCSSAGSSSPPPRRPPPWASRRAPPARGCTGHGAGCATGSQQHARPDGT